jgi:HEAT repeat protein
MKDLSKQNKYQFEDIKKALLNQNQPFPAAALYFFSDILQEDLDHLADVWPKVGTERRRALLEDMENLAEADTILFFDPVAIMCLADEDPVARATAIRLLWQSQNEDLVPRFIKMLGDDPESIVRAAAATALGLFVYLGEVDEIKKSIYDQVVKRLMRAHLSTDDDLVRRRALESLGYASHPEVPDFIQRAYDSQDDEWLQSALFAMGRSYDKRWVEPILTMINHPDNLVRYEAVRAAGELEAQDAREALFDLLEEGTDDDDLYFAAIWSLTKIGGDGVRNLIELALEETDDPDEVNFLEEALENLDFTEQVNMFDLMSFEDDDQEDWDDFDDEDLPYAY